MVLNFCFIKATVQNLVFYPLLIGFVELGSYVESLHLEKVLLREKSLWVRELPTSVPTWLLSELLLTRGCSALLVTALPKFFCTP